MIFIRPIAFTFAALLSSNFGAVVAGQEIPQHDLDYYAAHTEAHVFTSQSGQKMAYRIFMPEDEGSEKKFPLLISLHGAGHRGKDNLQHLTPYMVGWLGEAVQKDHPCIIVAPQCPTGQQWVDVPWKEGAYVLKETPIFCRYLG